MCSWHVTPGSAGSPDVRRGSPDPAETADRRSPIFSPGPRVASQAASPILRHLLDHEGHEVHEGKISTTDSTESTDQKLGACVAVKNRGSMGDTLFVGIADGSVRSVTSLVVFTRAHSSPTERRLPGLDDNSKGATILESSTESSTRSCCFFIRSRSRETSVLLHLWQCVSWCIALSDSCPTQPRSLIQILGFRWACPALHKKRGLTPYPMWTFIQLSPDGQGSDPFFVQSRASPTETKSETH